VDYSLFMAVMMVLMSKRVEKCPGATLAAFLSPFFAGIASVSVFCVFCRLL
jgi:short subunit fatty acids transporter